MSGDANSCSAISKALPMPIEAKPAEVTAGPWQEGKVNTGWLAGRAYPQLTPKAEGLGFNRNTDVCFADAQHCSCSRSRSGDECLNVKLARRATLLSRAQPWT